MNSFTFIVLTYNHEKCIIENLDSIKKIVEQYSCDRKINVLVADDCSKDGTVDTVKQWFSQNYVFFNELEIISQKKNIGTVRNLYSAIKKTKTNDFIIIAGDDKYTFEDIFIFYEGLKDGITIAPCVFLGRNSKLEGRLYRNYCFVKNLGNTKRISKMMKYDNLFAAPGVFFNAKYYRDPELWKRLFAFRLIEDYPSWRYFLQEKGLECHFEKKAYKCYRLDNGVSTKIDKNGVFYKDNKKLIKKYKIRNYILPKCINPFFYIWGIYRVWNIILIKKEKIKNG